MIETHLKLKKQMTELNYYLLGNEQGSYYRETKDMDAYQIYQRFSKQPDWFDDEVNQNKLDFIKGWTEAIMN